MESPPYTPITQEPPTPLSTSPNSFRAPPLSRRTSSFSSNNDRSPTFPRRSSLRSSRHRFSNASQLSNEFSPDGGGGRNGMGNLADELGELDDYEDGDVTGELEGEDEIAVVDGARDSGVDVSFQSRKGSPTSVKNFSKPFGIGGGKEKPPNQSEGQDEAEERLSPEIEDAINSVARMAAYAGTSEDPLFPRALALLQDLGNQSGLEVGVQRLSTATNSLTAHLTGQSKTLQGLATSMYSPLAMFSGPVDLEILEEIGPLVDALVKDLPHPDPAPLQQLQKLVRDTDVVISTLATLTDTVQMGKHKTNEASRHLRNTQHIVAELRRERERADVAREELQRDPWHDRVRERWCAKECRDVMGGFEEFCEGLKKDLARAGGEVVAV